MKKFVTKAERRRRIYRRKLWKILLLIGLYFAVLLVLASIKA